MRRLIIVGPRRQRWLAEVPNTHRERMRGLRGRTLGAGEAMLLERCRSVHTVGMTTPITAAFLDASWQVVRVYRLPAGRLARARGACHVLECHIGADVRVGDLLSAGADGPAIRDPRIRVDRRLNPTRPWRDCYQEGPDSTPLYSGGCPSFGR